MKQFFFSLAALLILSTSLRAQPAVDRVPGDAFLYVGWAGTEQLGASYDNSKLKKFLDSTTLDQIFAETLPALLKKANDEKPENADNIKAAQSLLQVLKRRPCGFYVSGMGKERSEEDRPLIHIGVIVQAGADKSALTDAITHLAKQMPGDDEMKLTFAAEGDTVGVLLSNDAKAKPLDAATKLSAAPAFTAAKAHFVAQPALTFFVDAEQAFARLDENIKADADEEEIDGWSKFYEASGFKGLRRIVMSAGFTTDEWLSQSFIEAPAPRKGIVKLLEPKPIDASLLARVPSDSVSAAIVNFDFADLLKTIKDMATAVDPQGGRSVQQAYGAVSMTLGRRIDTEIFGPLGSQWALYASPGQGAQTALGMIAVNKLDDAALAKAAWGDLYLALANMLPNLMRRQGVQITPTADDKAIPGETVYSFKISTVPAIPCFTVHNGYMYIGLDPTVLAKAATAADSPRLTEQPKIAAMLKEIEAPPNLTGLRYSDLAATGEDAANEIATVWPMLVDAAKRENIPLPDRLLPKAADLKSLLGPALGVSWMDEKGLYSRERSPFPGSSSFGYVRGDELTAVGVTAVGVSILLPSLSKARETANRVKGASNLRQIGMANLLYSNENKGDAAPDLGTLLKTQDLTVDVFTSPSSATDVPAEIRNGGPEKMAEWVNANSDMVYIKPAGKLTDIKDPANTPMAYEKLGIHGKDGTNILFADGHVEFMKADAATKALKDATGADPVRFVKAKVKRVPGQAPFGTPGRPQPKSDPAKEPGM